jgi:two-component system sensor histidine kinase CiaH
MFHSATLKLTGWYLLILMIISITFSLSIYAITSREVDTRLQRLQKGLQLTMDSPPVTDNTLRLGEASTASTHILVELIYANILILASGGVASYLLARRTLRPIKEAHEAQSRFTSDASHELRTPLAIMKTELEVTLRDKLADKNEYQNVIKSSLEEIEKLTNISEMLLHLSRLEHDKLEKTSVGIHQVTQVVLERLNQDPSRIAVTSGLHLKVQANETALSELISILVDNSLKYSPSDSHVSITIKSAGKFVSFDISNEGKGIDEIRLPHIFDRFYQADTSRTTGDKKGYGLGLALAKKIVELHEGELSATSGVDQVTTFSILLPVFHKK